MKTTKELAIELGLLRKRSVSSPGQNKHKRFKVSGQIFQYIIVLDFESTCWHDTKLIPQEIIEFPAVLMNTSNGKIESEFHYYVQPQEKPVLSDFCCELTGISQKQVDDGIPLHLCLKLFTQWLEKLYKEKKIQYFSTPEQNFNLCTFVTWSDWDLNLCLKNECRRKQLRKPPELNQWVDLRATYKKFYDRKPDGLNGALKDLGIMFQGREHSGVDDARNTACLAWRMIQDGCVLKITKILPGVPKHVSLAKTPIIKEMPKFQNGAQASRLDNGNLGKHKVSGIPVPTQGPNQGEKTNTPNKSTILNKTSTLKGSESTLQLKKFHENSGMLQKSLKLNDSLVPKCLDTKSKTVDNSISVSSADVLPKSTSANTTLISFPPKPQSNYIQLKKKFSVYSEKENTNTKNNQISKKDTSFLKDKADSKIANCSKTISTHSSAVKDISNTFITPNSLPSVKSNSAKISRNNLSEMKSTPPLCDCGRRAKLRLCHTPGANMGKTFFTCGLKGSNLKFKNKSVTACDFFKWNTDRPSLTSVPSHSLRSSSFMAQSSTSIIRENYNSHNNSSFSQTASSAENTPVLKKTKMRPYQLL